MHEILDEIKENKKGKPTYTKLAAFFALLSLSILTILWSSLSGPISANENVLETFRFLGLIMNISCLAGLIFSILSIIKKENLRIIKPISIFLNFLIFTLVLGAIIFARIMES